MRHTFTAKLLAALLLIAAADALFQDFRIGSWLGGLALGWTVTLLIMRPGMRRRGALVAAGVAIALAGTLLYDPGLLGWVMFWCALSIAALLPRTDGFDHAWRWALRLLAHAVSGPLSPVADLLRSFRVRPNKNRRSIRGTLTMAAMPLVMSAAFVALFASANPLIAKLFAAIRLPSVSEMTFWLFALLLFWPSLRPRALATRFGQHFAEPEISLPGASTSSVLLSLALFNLLFAIQNGLDLAFLWSGAPLPDGVTLADYAHRGAYPLIATALIAGLFVLGTLKPGSATAAHPMIRRLVVLWVAQNLLLVASSILRTCDYIAVYMLTAWRIAALAWIALVGLGLVLICWRMLSGRSARWLINANALAASLLLGVCTLVDLDAVAAHWNVRHAREVGGTGTPLDLCQLSELHGSALTAIAELEQRPLHPAFRDRLRFIREPIYRELIGRQSDWHQWTWRGAIRLREARAVYGDHPPLARPVPPNFIRNCDGAITQQLTETPAS